MNSETTAPKPILIVLKLASLGAAITGAILSFMAMNGSLSYSVEKNLVPIVLVLVGVIVVSRIVSAAIQKKSETSS